MNNINITGTKRQGEAFKYLTDDKTRYVMYGGAKGGGKSFLLCLWTLIWCKRLCDLFKLEVTDHPIPLGFIGRKQATDFKKTTLETWKKIIPRQFYEIKKQDNEIWLFGGKCKVFFGGLDSTETINKFNSAELAFFAIDQAEETNREEVSVLRGSLRLTHKGKKPQYKELYTANPGDCWLKEDFIDHDFKDHVYIPALPTDNPHLPDDYIDTLETAFKHSQGLLRAYRDGDWQAIKSTNLLVSMEDLNALKGLVRNSPIEKKIIVCDPATSFDECVIYYMNNYEILDERILVGELDEMKIAGHIAMMAKKHKVVHVGGDSIGLGGGVFARLKEIGEYKTMKIKSSEKSLNPQFLNKRAEMAWNFMERVLNKELPFPEDEELRRQLINVTYEVSSSNGMIKITSKDKLKKVLSRSPDRADAYIMGVYMTDSIKTWEVKKRDRYSDDSYGYDFNPMTI